jgi:hypothetical protein
MTPTATKTPTITPTSTSEVTPPPPTFTPTATKTTAPTHAATPTATTDPGCPVVQRGVFGTVADAYIWAASPDYTGNSDTLYTGIVGGGRKQTLIRFDLGFLPAGAVVDSATLEIYQTSGGSSRTVNVHRILAAWSETSVTWNNFGGYAGTPVAWFGASSAGWKAVGVTALAQGWASGAYANYGLLLDDPTTGADEYETFKSSEYGTASYRPKLTVCYHSGATFTPTATASFTVTATPTATRTPTVTPTSTSDVTPPPPTFTATSTKTTAPTATRTATWTPTPTPPYTHTPTPTPTAARTYYVRSDGGSAEQCTGLADAPYPGGGTAQPCAWRHPFVALPPGGTPRIQGGDTLLIRPGSYMLGYGAAETDNCSADYPWDCTMPAIPAGPDAAHKTRILGGSQESGERGQEAGESGIGNPRLNMRSGPSAGSGQALSRSTGAAEAAFQIQTVDSIHCANPPELWGTERAYQLLDLTGSSNVEIGCLELTDHASCVEFHTGGLACQRNAYPFGPWAVKGIYAEDAANVYLHDLNIHGFADTGIQAGRLTDWTVENVRIAGNGWAGWDGDISGDDGNAGALAFRRWTVEWNGCVETWPGGKATGCWAQTAGGYGDGVGTGETGGHWIIEDSVFRYNTSDGLDLLYVRRPGSQIEVRRTRAEGNAGNQIKTTGPALIENSIIVGNCGFFEGQPFTYNVDACRAYGNAVDVTLKPGDQATLTNNSLTSEGDCLVVAGCTGTCNGSERVRLRNNLFQGQTDFQQPFERTCLAYQEDFPADPFDFDYSAIAGVKDDACPGSHAFCGLPLGIANTGVDSFDAHLLAGSPAIDAGTAAGAPASDFDGRPRDAAPDIGAYEYVAGTVTPTPTATRTATPTSTPVFTATPTSTPVFSVTPTETATPPFTPTPTPTHTHTPTPPSTHTPTPPPTHTPTPVLPDLTLHHVYFRMRGDTGGCVLRYDALMFYVCVANQGAADAGPFTIAVNEEDRTRAEGVAAGAVRCFESGFYNFGFNPVLVVLDRYNEVAESNEANNAWDSVYPLPIPTPPLLCTATPTATATPSPTPTTPATATPTATPALSTIEGRVWDDGNRNGIRDEGEGGIAGLRLTLDPAAVGRLRSATERTTMTDADGYFRFADVPPGAHTLRAENPAGRWPTTPLQVNTATALHQTVPVSFGFYAPPVIRYLPLVAR